MPTCGARHFVLIRMHVCQITSADGRHSCTLQGESKHQCEEWIATVRNISAGLYLEDNPREAIDRARQASMSESSSTSQISEPKQEAGLSFFMMFLEAAVFSFRPRVFSKSDV